MKRHTGITNGKASEIQRNIFRSFQQVIHSCQNSINNATDIPDLGVRQLDHERVSDSKEAVADCKGSVNGDLDGGEGG